MVKKMFIILLLICLNIYGQKKQLELVSIKDKNLKNILSTLVSSKHKNILSKCHIYWYIRQIKPDYYIASISQNPVLIKREDKKKYLTLINDALIFIIINDDKIINKTNFHVDISHMTQKMVFFGRDFSYWIIKNNEKEKTKIIYEKIYTSRKK